MLFRSEGTLSENMSERGEQGVVRENLRTRCGEGQRGEQGVVRENMRTRCGEGERGERGVVRENVERHNNGEMSGLTIPEACLGLTLYAAFSLACLKHSSAILTLRRDQHLYLAM